MYNNNFTYLDDIIDLDDPSGYDEQSDSVNYERFENYTDNEPNHFKQPDTFTDYNNNQFQTRMYEDKSPYRMYEDNSLLNTRYSPPAYQNNNIDKEMYFPKSKNKQDIQQDIQEITMNYNIDKKTEDIKEDYNAQVDAYQKICEVCESINKNSNNITNVYLIIIVFLLVVILMLLKKLLII